MNCPKNRTFKLEVPILRACRNILTVLCWLMKGTNKKKILQINVKLLAKIDVVYKMFDIRCQTAYITVPGMVYVPYISPYSIGPIQYCPHNQVYIPGILYLVYTLFLNLIFELQKKRKGNFRMCVFQNFENFQREQCCFHSYLR